LPMRISGPKVNRTIVRFADDVSGIRELQPKKRKIIRIIKNLVKVLRIESLAQSG